MACNIAFFASHPIAIPAIRALDNHSSVALVGIVTQPDRRSGRGQRLQANAIKQWAMDHQVAVTQPASKPGEATVAWLNTLGVELIFVMAYGHILRRDLLLQPRLGIFNFHASLLPKYRGASPIEAAIAAGEVRTGVTLMAVVPKMDAGDILDQEVVAMSLQDTAATVADKLAAACVPLITRNIDLLLNQQALQTPQDNAAATYTRKLTKEDGFIHFSVPATVIANRIRAMTPWPGAFLEYHNERIKLGRVSCLAMSSTTVAAAEPGSVLGLEQGALLIATADGVLAMHELQRPGGRLLPAADFLRGFPIEPGARLTGGPMAPLVSPTPFPYKNPQSR